MLRTLGLVMTAVVAFGVTGAAAAYSQLQGNITGVNIDGLLGDDRPDQITTPDPDDPNKGLPVNILVMGSDTREGQAISDDGTEGQRSDTTIVLHISADRQRVDAVSIPRDSLVDIPSCLRSDGSESRSQNNAMFNSAFSIGGESGEVADAAACTQKTVEAATGVYINHFVVVNMNGFIKMVDALGGVPMCIEQDMRSTKAHLDLKAGQQTLDGTTALAFARARTGTGLGNGSDTDRISRQQEMLASTARTVLSKNLLTDVPQLLRFLDAATESLTVSSGIASIPDMTGLAYSLRSVPSGNITFMTIPWRPAASDRNRVEWTAEAADVWANMAADKPLVPVATPPATTAPTASTTSAPTGTATTPASTPTATKTPGKDPFSPDDLPTACG